MRYGGDMEGRTRLMGVLTVQPMGNDSLHGTRKSLGGKELTMSVVLPR